MDISNTGTIFYNTPNDARESKSPSFNQTSLEKSRVAEELRQANIGIFAGRRVPNNELGKDAFLKILIEQLKNQDPTNPVQDKEFIAQMAQFNSLEQMMQLNKNFTGIASSINRGQAINLLGKTASFVVALDRDGNDIVKSGRVSGVSAGSETPMLTIDNQQYALDKIIKFEE